MTERRSGWRLWLTIALTLGLLALVVHQFGGARGFMEAASDANPVWIAVAFALACTSVVVTTQRWRQVLDAMGHPLGYGEAFYAVLAAWPLSVVTPSRAGDLARPFVLRDRLPLSTGAGSVLAEKVIDVHALLVAALVCGAAYRLWEICGVVLLLLVLEYLAVAFVLRGRNRLLRIGFFARRADKVEALYAAFDRLAARPGALLSISASALAVRLLTVGMVDALLRSVGVDAGFLLLVAPWMLATLAGLLPLTLAGMGTRDAAFVMLLHVSGGAAIPEPAILVATVGYSVLAIWSFALAGLPLLAKATLGRRALR